MGYYWALLYDPSLLVLLLVAIGVIYHANTRTKTRRTSETSSAIIPVAEESEMRESLSPWKILILPVIGSIILIVLFYFLKILRYLLVAIIAISSFSSVAFVTYPCWYHIIQLTPPSSRGRTIRLPSRVAGWLDFSLLPTAVPISMLFSTFCICTWLITNNWIITNLIALCLGVTSIVSLQIPNAMIATLLLTIFWAYDIFWVFISPLIFPKNVMETVAVGVSQLELPMLFKIPRLLPLIKTAALDQWPPLIPNFFAIFGYFEVLLEQLGSAGFIMLGLGDIILPGLALNFFFRRDEYLAFEEDDISTEINEDHADNGLDAEMTELETINNTETRNLDIEQQTPLASNESIVRTHLRSGWKVKLTYYLVAQIGYAFGLVLTFLMLILLKRGQPALLYLVPCTLIPPFLLAWQRGQFLWLWKTILFTNEPNEAISPSNDQIPENSEDASTIALEPQE